MGLDITILGLSITSSWGNGHATNFRALVKALVERGHSVVFLERDVPWYAEHRDLPDPPHGTLHLYDSVDELRDRFTTTVKGSDLVIVGSYVPEGVAVGEWVTDAAQGLTAFYDIDTPVTLAKLDRGDHEYLAPHLVARFDLYLSFTGGPTLERLEHELGARRARPFYCLVDPELYRPMDAELRWDLGYLGTYSDDRQPALERLLLDPARQLSGLRAVVAGPRYPEGIDWPPNVERVDHLSPSEHVGFYAAQRFTLNVTRADMVRAGYSPSVRLFEAAACGVPVISDPWPGLDEFFSIGQEILVARDAREVLRWLEEVGDEERRSIGERARRRVLHEHTAERRVEELEAYVGELSPAGGMQAG